MERSREDIEKALRDENTDHPALAEKEKAAREAFLAHRTFVTNGGDFNEVQKRGKDVLEKIAAFEEAGGKWDPLEQIRKDAEEKKNGGNGSN